MEHHTEHMARSLHFQFPIIPISLPYFVFKQFIGDYILKCNTKITLKAVKCNFLFFQLLMFHLTLNLSPASTFTVSISWSPYLSSIFNLQANQTHRTVLWAVIGQLLCCGRSLTNHSSWCLTPYLCYFFPLGFSCWVLESTVASMNWGWIQLEDETTND